MGNDLRPQERESCQQNCINYEAFFNTIDDFLFVIDTKGRLLHFNTVVVQRLGYKYEELSGAELMTLHPLERREEAIVIFREMVEGRARVCPIPLITRDGLLIPVETTVTKGVWNSQPALFGISKDISRLKFSEEKFAKSFYFNPTPCGFSDLTTNKFVEVNDAVCQLLEYSSDELIGRTAVELEIFTDHQMKEILSEADEAGKVVNISTRLKTKSGRTLDVILSAENMYVADKRYRFTVVNDVTGTLAAQQLNEQYSRLQELMIKISSTYINIELEKVELVIQESLQEMAEFVNADRAYIFDYDFKQNVCNNTFEWCREGISAEIDNLQHVPLDFIPNWLGTHRKGEAFYMPDINLLPNNGPFSVRGLLEPQGVKSLITLPMTLNGELVGFVGFDSVRDYHRYSQKERDLLVVFSQMLVNIAERKRQAEALIHAKNEAEEASKTKEVFLATMSHEIRTPLNVITGMVRELLKNTIPASQLALLTNAKSAAIHLLSILNNILDLSKIDAGEFVLDNGVFDIAMLVNDAESIMTLRAQEKNIELKLEVEPAMDTVYFGDEARIRQVLINLIDNAIKFTESGNVTVKIWQGGFLGEKRELHVEVSDTGIGISPEFLGKLFAKFSQEDNDTRRKYQGTGLGMSIVKHFIQLMGGDIEVKSKKGEGSVFHFYIQLKPARRELLPVGAPVISSTPDLSGRRILVVEDNDMNRYVVYLSLKALNCEILEAENGEQAIELLRNEKVDLIFMDIQMPVMDGVEATHVIRDELKLKVPVIALTANAFKHNVERYLEAGMNDFLVKPYLEKDFNLVLNKYLPPLNVSKAGTTGVLLFDLQQLKELCKNDELFLQNMMRIFIKVTGESVPLFDSLLADQDYKGISKLAHKLKPGIDNLSVLEIKDKIRLLEKADPKEISLQAYVSLIKEITSSMSAVSEEMKKYLQENELPTVN